MRVYRKIYVLTGSLLYIVANKKDSFLVEGRLRLDFVKKMKLRQLENTVKVVDFDKYFGLE